MKAIWSDMCIFVRDLELWSKFGLVNFSFVLTNIKLKGLIIEGKNFKLLNKIRVCACWGV